METSRNIDHPKRTSNNRVTRWGILERRIIQICKILIYSSPILYVTQKKNLSLKKQNFLINTTSPTFQLNNTVIITTSSIKFKEKGKEKLDAHKKPIKLLSRVYN